MSDKRVLLVKPGDILLIGNLGGADSKEARSSLAERCAEIGDSLESVGILAFMFAGDIEIDKVPGLAEHSHCSVTDPENWRPKDRLHIDPMPGTRAHP